MCPELKSRVQDTLVTGSSGRQLPVLPQLVAEQGPGLTSLELKQMGRDTIAGLIAGILQKYTKREAPRKRGTGRERERQRETHT